MKNNILVLLFCLLFLTGCFRGSRFEDPPIHLNPNMDNQQKYRSLEESYFFDDPLNISRIGGLIGNKNKELNKLILNIF